MPDFLDEPSIAALLVHNAAEAPDAGFLTFEDGSAWTRRRALDEVCGAANELRHAGVAQGDVVAAALPNGAGYFRVWWGAAMLGAATVPVNPMYRGALVRRMLDGTEPKVVVTDAAFRERLDDVGVPATTTVLDPTELISADHTFGSEPPGIRPWDTAALALTSGTTGPSKVVRVTHAHCASGAWTTFGRHELTPDDVYLCDVPMVHVSGLYAVYAAVRAGSRIAVRTRPALDAYWEVARDTGATLSQLYSTMVTYVDGRPLRGAERSHRLRLVVALPLPADPVAFQAKFDIPQLTIGWGSTEIGSPVGSLRGEAVVAGSTGRIFPGWEVRLVDEHDVEVPPGEPGRAIVRHATPWVLTTEYVGDPAATAEAWRNGWFHTGDVLRCDADGNYFFVDRVKDALRRRGQNISSFEVETVVLGFSGVLEAAVVPERSATEVEDEVKVWIVVGAGRGSVDFVELLHHCARNLPHYMVPRFYELTTDLPRTPSGKIQKHLLRERGSGSATWDRRAHGLDVTRRGVAEIGSSHPSDAFVGVTGGAGVD